MSLGAKATSLPFTVRTTAGRGTLALSGFRVFDWLELTRLELAAALDREASTITPAQLQRRRTQLEHAELRLDQAAVDARVAAMAPAWARHGITQVLARIRDGFVTVSARVADGLAAADLTFKIQAVPSGRHLRAIAADARVYGHLPTPAPVLAHRLLTTALGCTSPAAATGPARQRGLGDVELDALPAVLWHVLPPRGWRLPASPGVALASAEVAAGAITLSFAVTDRTPITPALLAILDELALTDQLLLGGQLDEAMRGYRALLAVGADEQPLLVERILAITAARPAWFLDGVELARQALDRWPDYLPAHSALASIALSQGDAREASLQLEAMSAIAERHGDHEGAALAALAAARLVRVGNPTAADGLYAKAIAMGSACARPLPQISSAIAEAQGRAGVPVSEAASTERIAADTSAVQAVGDEPTKAVEGRRHRSTLFGLQDTKREAKVAIAQTPSGDRGARERAGQLVALAARGTTAVERASAEADASAAWLQAGELDLAVHHAGRAALEVEQAAVPPRELRRRIYAGLGESAWQRRVWEDVVRAYRVLLADDGAIELRATSAYRLAVAADKLGETDLAAAALAQLVVDPSAPTELRSSAFRMLADFHDRAGEPGRAAAALETWAQDQTDDGPARADALHRAGEYYRRAGRHADAVRCFELALDNVADHIPALDALEQVERASGNLERVATIVGRKVAASGRHPERQKALLIRLAELQSQLGRGEIARATYERVLELDPVCRQALRFVADEKRRLGEPAADLALAYLRLGEATLGDESDLAVDDRGHAVIALAALLPDGEPPPWHQRAYAIARALPASSPARTAAARLSGEAAPELDASSRANASKLRHDADRAVARGRLGEARALLVTASELAPDEALTFEKLAEVASQLGEWPLAARALAELAALLAHPGDGNRREPRRAEVLLELADLRYDRLGDVAGARAAMRDAARALGPGSRHDATLRLLASEAMSRRDYDDAAAAYLEIPADRRLPADIVAIATAWQRQGRAQLATGLLEEAQSAGKLPDDGAALLYALHQERRRKAELAAALERRAEIHPEDAVSRLEEAAAIYRDVLGDAHGQARVAQRLAERTGRTAETVRAHQPGGEVLAAVTAEVLESRAAAAALTGDARRAAELYADALEARLTAGGEAEQILGALAVLRLMSERAARPELLVDALPRVAAALPGESAAEIWLELGELAGDLGNSQVAGEALARAHQLSPGQSTIIAAYAAHLRRSGAHRQAIAASERSLAAAAGTARARPLYELAITRREMGDGFRAAELLAAAHQADPDLALVWLPLADALVAADDLSSASDLYERLLARSDLDDDSRQFVSSRLAALHHDPSVIAGEIGTATTAPTGEGGTPFHPFSESNDLPFVEQIDPRNAVPPLGPSDEAAATVELRRPRDTWVGTFAHDDTLELERNAAGEEFETSAPRFAADDAGSLGDTKPERKLRDTLVTTTVRRTPRTKAPSGESNAIPREMLVADSGALDVAALVSSTAAPMVKELVVVGAQDPEDLSTTLRGVFGHWRDPSEDEPAVGQEQETVPHPRMTVTIAPTEPIRTETAAAATAALRQEVPGEAQPARSTKPLGIPPPPPAAVTPYDRELAEAARLAAAGDLDAAIGRYEAAAHHAPELADGSSDPRALIALEELYARLGNGEAMSEALGRQIVATANPRMRAQLWRRRSILYRDLLHREAETYRCLKEAHACAPDDPDIAFELRAIAMARGEWALAAALLYREIAGAESARDRAALHLELALIFDEKLLDVDQARANYEQSLAIDPEIPASLRPLAEIYERAGRHTDASAMFERAAVAARANDRGVLLRRAGASALRGGRITDARRVFEAATTAAGAVGDAETLAAVRGDLARIIDDADRTARLEQRLAEAKQTEERVLALEQLLADAHSRGDVLAASQHAAALLTVNAQHAGAFRALAARAEANRNWVELAALLDARAKHVTDRDERAALFYQLGRLHMQERHDAVAAARAFDAALDADAEHPGALEGRAELAWQTGDFQRADVLYGRLAPARSTMAADALWLRRSEIAEKLDRIDRALRFAQEATRHGPPRSEVLSRVARLAAKHGDLEAAVTAARTALELMALGDAPAVVAARIELAEMCRRAGNEAGAIDELELAVTDDPKNLRALEQLAELYERHGKWTAAAKILEALAALADLPVQRAALLYRVGEIRLIKLRDPAADDAFLKASDLDPQHLPTLRRLIEVYWRADDPQALIDVANDLRERRALFVDGIEPVTLARAFITCALHGQRELAVAIGRHLHDQAASAIALALAELIGHDGNLNLDDAARAVIELADHGGPSPAAIAKAARAIHRGTVVAAALAVDSSGA